MMAPVPPRRKEPADPLGENELARLRGALAEGRRPTVYLRDPVPSLGLEPACSARVVSVQDSTVTVRPKGVGDDVPFEAGELYDSRAAAINAASAVTATKRPPSGRSRASKPRPPNPAVSPAPAPAPKAETDQETAAAPAPAQQAARASSSRVTLTISGTANGGWTVQCAQGSAKRGAAVPVAADAVARAVQALGEENARAAVEAVLEHARREAAARVAALRAELEQAQQTLNALSAEQR